LDFRFWIGDFYIPLKASIIRPCNHIVYHELTPMSNSAPPGALQEREGRIGGTGCEVCSPTAGPVYAHCTTTTLPEPSLLPLSAPGNRSPSSPVGGRGLVILPFFAVSPLRAFRSARIHLCRSHLLSESECVILSKGHNLVWFGGVFRNDIPNLSIPCWFTIY